MGCEVLEEGCPSNCKIVLSGPEVGALQVICDMCVVDRVGKDGGGETSIVHVRVGGHFN